jgi:tetratricopeptide (TPR) repeat protein
MKKKRLTRKELLKEPDEFITTTGRVIRWVKANPKPVVYGAGAFLAIIMFVAAYGYYQDNRARVSAELLGQILSQYQRESADDDPAQALTRVVPDFDRLIENFSGQPAGRLGCVFYAHFSLKGGEPQKAAELYRKALKRNGNDPSLEPIILYGLASACEAAGDTSEAISTYERVLSLATMTNKDNALFHLGRLYAKEGDPEKSREMYEKLAADYPDSAFAQLARERAAG